MKWFRLHTEIKDDPKMLELDDHQFRLWISILSMAGEADERGIIPAYRPRGLAAALHTTVESMDSAFALFSELGMVERREDGSLLVSNFMDRQYDNLSDHPEKVAERKARYKERQQNEPPAARSVKEQAKNDTGTTTEREGTPILRRYSDSDSDSETETEKKEPGNKNYQGAAKPTAGRELVQVGNGDLPQAANAVKIFIDLFTEKTGGPPDIPPRFTKALKETLGRVGEQKFRDATWAFLSDGWASESGFSVETFVGRPVDRWLGAKANGSGGKVVSAVDHMDVLSRQVAKAMGGMNA
jgi:hypothetical protein